MHDNDPKLCFQEGLLLGVRIFWANPTCGERDLYGVWFGGGGTHCGVLKWVEEEESWLCPLTWGQSCQLGVHVGKVHSSTKLCILTSVTG
jgi:hypothetical protein